MTLERACTGAVEIIEDIEREQAKIDAINEAAKTKRAPHADAISSLKKRCRDDFNIEASALAVMLAKRRQERRILARIAALKENPRAQVDQMEMIFDKAESEDVGLMDPAPAPEEDIETDFDSSTDAA